MVYGAVYETRGREDMKQETPGMLHWARFIALNYARSIS